MKDAEREVVSAEMLEAGCAVYYEDVAEAYEPVWKDRLMAAYFAMRRADRATRARPVVSEEERAEAFIQAAIDNSPEPLRRLGEYLSRVLDENQWKTAESVLIGDAVARTRPIMTEAVSARAGEMIRAFANEHVDRDDSDRCNLLWERLITLAEDVEAIAVKAEQEDWHPVDPPQHVWLRTKREGETGENVSCLHVSPDGDRIWTERGTSRDTCANSGSFAAPTHWMHLSCTTEEIKP